MPPSPLASRPGRARALSLSPFPIYSPFSRTHPGCVATKRTRSPPYSRSLCSVNQRHPDRSRPGIRKGSFFGSGAEARKPSLPWIKGILSAPAESTGGWGTERFPALSRRWRDRIHLACQTRFTASFDLQLFQSRRILGRTVCCITTCDIDPASGHSPPSGVSCPKSWERRDGGDCALRGQDPS